ncbi:MAG: hypothetical protein C5B59_07825 [Bacteroidetes bacterium]|nr:MAG: hypothetical protein C5B59_07825 [Bacteroidota bacterium]
MRINCGVAGNKSSGPLPGPTVFPQTGGCITKDELEIFHVMRPNMALATFRKSSNEIYVLLINYDGKSYYDQQKIQVPPNTCARQIGTY